MQKYIYNINNSNKLLDVIKILSINLRYLIDSPLIVFQIPVRKNSECIGNKLETEREKNCLKIDR